MRILQLVSSTGFYGAERMITLLSSSLQTAGAEVCLGLFNAGEQGCAMFTQEAERLRIPVWNFRCRGKLDLKALQRLRNFLVKQRIDVVHSHGYKANLYALVAARLVGCGVIATCHNWTRRTHALKQYASIDRYVLRHFDSVVAVSKDVAVELRTSNIHRVKMISNGINVATFQNVGPWPPSQTTVIGCLSRLSKEKGVDVLLWALPRVLAVHPHIQCIVAGNGPERERLRALSDKLGISSSVHMPGFCEDTAHFLKQCTLVVQPSRKEAMPMAVLEAMAAGKAIIASAVGEIPRLFEDGNAGMLVPPNNPEKLSTAILALLSNPGLRQELEKRASAKASTQFDASFMADQYIQVYSFAALRHDCRSKNDHRRQAGTNR